MFGQSPYFLKVAVPPDPAWIYEKLGGPEKSYGFILESSLISRRLGRYSWVGVDPFLVIEAKDNSVKLINGKREDALTADPFETLERLLNKYLAPPPPASPVPFWGGAVGYFGYDLGRRLEVLPSLAADDLALPDLFLGFYHTVVAVDHLAGDVFACSSGLPGETAGEAGRRAEGLANILGGHTDTRASQKSILRAAPNTLAEMGEVSLDGIRSHFSKESYCRAVERCKEYIAAGDIFQVNLSQRLTSEINAGSWELYKKLRRVNPAPFASYLRFPRFEVVGNSPERFIRLAGRRVETRPIKGTRPRGKDDESDRAMREELWNSAKDRAELTMIIDLERNDLGRVCEIGTVRVPELFRLEDYPTVFHLVSTVTGKLAGGKNVIDLLRATFPGGSITGAPKIRAMEIIEELEPVRRGIYTGSTGWIGFHGDADLNIVIRTIVVKDGLAHYQVGGGLTADSAPEAEYEETLDKARALIKALAG